MTLEHLVYHIRSIDLGLSLYDSMHNLSLWELEKSEQERKEKEKELVQEVLKTLKENRKRNKRKKLKGRVWSKIRILAIKKMGDSCLKCGVTPERKNLHMDHIKPKSKYPNLKFKLYNIQPLCKKCNFSKGNKDETDYREIKYSDYADLCR